MLFHAADIVATGLPFRHLARTTAQLVSAAISQRVIVGGAKLRLHARPIHRWSIVAGNLRIQRLLDRLLHPGDHFVDVGANIGYNTAYGAALVGARGRVVAIEPTPDSLAVLRDHVSANRLEQVTVVGVAAGRRRERRRLYVRGAVSAVNSLYAEGCYGSATALLDVEVRPLDELVACADVVKIDVEGAEIEVLNGMTALIAHHQPALIIEWHPLLQQAAGFAPAQLPSWLRAHGYHLTLAWHTHDAPLPDEQIDATAHGLIRRQRSVELVATAPGDPLPRR